MGIFDTSAFNRQLIVIVAAAAALSFAMWLAEKLVRKLLLRLFPPVDTEAVVIAKRLEVKAKTTSKKAYTVYYMTFQPMTGGFERGKRVEYETPKERYALCAEGDKGLLTVHMNKFLEFK
ncbi:MAG: DUF2500 domain-containing protein [Clostridiales bacterium]|nr:DUF2500 domain-containing protein [Clostridiales bacterium]